MSDPMVTFPYMYVKIFEYISLITLPTAHLFCVPHCLPFLFST